MYGKKSQPPYNQFANRSNQLYEQEQYEEENSQPLIEEIDPNYQPNDRQVKQYAIEELGMSLPQDEGLLYIAKEGLKAPLPPNWVPYQGRDGQVYYKHRITQEKTYDHPTDIEYRKKYLQQKQKMARTNLKSINMKQNLNIGPQSGFGLGSGAGVGNPSGLFGKISQSNVFGQVGNQSHFGQVSNQLVKEPEYLSTNLKLDSKVQEQYHRQLEIYQAKLKKEWKQFEEEEQEAHQKKIKKLKEQFEKSMSSIYQNANNPAAYNVRLKEEKEKLKDLVEEDCNEAIQKQLKEFQRQLQKMNREYEHVYSQDNNLKIQKYKQEKQLNYEQKETRCNLKVKQLSDEREKKKKDQEIILVEFKKNVQNENNREIEQETSKALNEQIRVLTQQWEQKLKKHQSEMDRQYDETKRVLGYDINGYLAQLTQKKVKLKTMSQQKLSSLKKKQVQAISYQLNLQYENSIKDIQKQVNAQAETQIQFLKKSQAEKLIKNKQKIDKQLANKIQQKISQIYQESGSRINSFQSEMNKKLATLQNNFIDTIHNKSEEMTKSLSKKMELKLKQQTIENKEHIIQSLKRQLSIQKSQWNKLKFQRDLSMINQKDLDDYFYKKAKELDLEFKPDAFFKFEEKYLKLKSQYKKDKELLASLMLNLQNHHHGKSGKTSQLQSNMTILKQYNSDVRIMRMNEENLRKIQMLLKKAQINDKEAIQELGKKMDFFQYKDIQLRLELEGKRSRQSPEIIQMNENEKEQMQNMGHNSYYSHNLRNVETTLKEHSKFLSTVKQELNRKLYQVRNNSTYSIY